MEGPVTVVAVVAIVAIVFGRGLLVQFGTWLLRTGPDEPRE